MKSNDYMLSPESQGDSTEDIFAFWSTHGRDIFTLTCLMSESVFANLHSELNSQHGEKETKKTRRALRMTCSSDKKRAKELCKKNEESSLMNKVFREIGTTSDSITDAAFDLLQTEVECLLGNKCDAIAHYITVITNVWIFYHRLNNRQPEDNDELDPFSKDMQKHKFNITKNDLVSPLDIYFLGKSIGKGSDDRHLAKYLDIYLLPDPKDTTLSDKSRSDKIKLYRNGPVFNASAVKSGERKNSVYPDNFIIKGNGCLYRYPVEPSDTKEIAIFRSASAIQITWRWLMQVSKNAKYSPESSKDFAWKYINSLIDCGKAQ